MPKGKLRRGSKSVNYRSARDIDAEELHRDIAEDFVALIEPRNENEFLHALENVNSPIYKRLQVLLFEMGVEADIARVCEEIAAYVTLEKQKQKQQFLEDLRAEEVKKQKEIQIENARVQQEEQSRLAAIRELQSVDKIEAEINRLTIKIADLDKQAQQLTNKLQNLPQIHQQINAAWQVQQKAQVAAIMQHLIVTPLVTSTGVPIILDPKVDPDKFEKYEKSMTASLPLSVLDRAPDLLHDVSTPKQVETLGQVIGNKAGIKIELTAMRSAAEESRDERIFLSKQILDAIKLNKKFSQALKPHVAAMQTIATESVNASEVVIKRQQADIVKQRLVAVAERVQCQDRLQLVREAERSPSSPRPGRSSGWE